MHKEIAEALIRLIDILKWDTSLNQDTKIQLHSLKEKLEEEARGDN